jgi:hypothetical protein
MIPICDRLLAYAGIAARVESHIDNGRKGMREWSDPIDGAEFAKDHLKEADKLIDDFKNNGLEDFAYLLSDYDEEEEILRQKYAPLFGELRKRIIDERLIADHRTYQLIKEKSA